MQIFANYILILPMKSGKIGLKSETTQRFVVACSHLRFESCVVLEGNQTQVKHTAICAEFESCVVLEGNQTTWLSSVNAARFESCVVLEGNQTMNAVTSGDE